MIAEREDTVHVQDEHNLLRAIDQPRFVDKAAVVSHIIKPTKNKINVTHFDSGVQLNRCTKIADEQADEFVHVRPETLARDLLKTKLCRTSTGVPEKEQDVRVMRYNLRYTMQHWHDYFRQLNDNQTSGDRCRTRGSARERSAAG